MISENCFLMVILGLVVLGSELALILEYYDKGSRNKCFFLYYYGHYLGVETICFSSTFALKSLSFYRIYSKICYWQK